MCENERTKARHLRIEFTVRALRNRRSLFRCRYRHTLSSTVLNGDLVDENLALYSALNPQQVADIILFSIVRYYLPLLPHGYPPTP